MKSKNQRNILIESSLSQVLIALTSGTLLTGYALSVGADESDIGLLAAIPPLCYFFQFLAIFINKHFANKKNLILNFLFLHRAVWLSVALSPFVPFFATHKLGVLYLALLVGSILSAMANPLWSGWVKDIIPEKGLGGFFSKRFTYTKAVSIIMGILMGSLFLKWREWTGLSQSKAFSYVFLLGVIMGTVALLFMAKTSYTPQVVEKEQSLIEQFKILFENKNLKALLGFLFVWNFSVNLTAPLFAMYMLKVLKINISYVIFLSVLSNIMNLVSFKTWGKLSDQYSNKSVIAACAPACLMGILFWLALPFIKSTSLLLLILAFIYILVGVATAGIILSTNTIGLKLAPSDSPIPFIAACTTISSIASGLAPVIGGYWLEKGLTWWPIQSVGSVEKLGAWNWLFLVSGAGTLLALRFLYKVQENSIEKSRLQFRFALLSIRREMVSFTQMYSLAVMNYLPGVSFRKKNDV